MAFWRGKARRKRSLSPQKRDAFLRTELLLFLPTIALCGHWFGLIPSLAIALLALILGWITRPHPIDSSDEAPNAAQPNAESLSDTLDVFMREARRRNLATACLVCGLDQARALRAELGEADYAALMARLAERLGSVLREGDRIVPLGSAHFALALPPGRNRDTEALIQLAVRLQSVCETPFQTELQSLSVTLSCGICPADRAPEQNGAACLRAARGAADDAARQGPNSIKIFAARPPVPAATGLPLPSLLAPEIGRAIDDGRIVAFFRPQISTDTGEVSGITSVPRWLHPRHGTLEPRSFMPAIRAAGMLDQLGNAMLRQTAIALRELSHMERLPGPPMRGHAAMIVPEETMRLPDLGERMKWNLDRFEIAPERLSFVLRQKVVSQLHDPKIVANMAALAALGAEIELSGFDTSPALTEVIRNMLIRRIRLPRSLTAHAESYGEPQRFLAAIIAMADSMGIETLAEEVTTAQEISFLGQLGCRHVSGPAISAPLPLGDLQDWIRRHAEKLKGTPKLPLRRGA